MNHAFLLLSFASSPITALPALSSTNLVAKAPNRNLTSLGPLTLLGRHPFGCEIVYDHESPQISPIAFYLNVIDTVYYLSALDQRRTWPLSSRSLDEYNLEVGFGPAPWMPQEPPLLRTRWVLLTLQIMAIEFGGDKVWKPMAGVALWHGEIMGMVGVQQKNSPRIFAETTKVQDEDHDAVLIMEEKAGEIFHPSNNSRVSAIGEMKVSYSFNEKAGPLKSIDVFTLTINTFILAAQKGLDSQVEKFTEWSAILGDTTIKVLARKDSYGNVQLRNDHIRTAMKRIIEVMVTRKKFMTMNFVLSIDDVEIATGRVYQPQPDSMTMSSRGEESFV